MRPLLILLLCLSQDPKLERDVRLANTSDNPMIMGQAIDKLIRRGKEAIPAILKFVKDKGYNALSIGMTDALGRFEDERITKLCVDLVGKKGFYWRPAAMRSLAKRVKEEHLQLMRHLLGDRLWGVRMAAIQGLERLKDKASIPAFKKILADDVYDVRAQAARTLYSFGDESGLPVLVDALRQDTMWFEIDYGQLAREDAWNFLKKISKDTFGFKPWESEQRRAAGLKKWDAWMTKRDPEWRSRVPKNIRARKDTAEYQFGFELRSCQKGDFFFRIDTKNNLVLGCFNIVRAKLTDEELKRFRAALKKLKRVDFSVPYGRGGCDFEKYYVVAGEEQFDKLWIGIGGRPKGVEDFITTCRDLIKAKFGVGEARDFFDKSTIFRETE